jgi:hypothetical protein
LLTRNDNDGVIDRRPIDTITENMVSEFSDSSQIKAVKVIEAIRFLGKLATTCFF